MNQRFQTLAWWLALVALVTAFFGPTLWGGASLVPSDILHEIMRPYSASVTVPRVQNHYASDALVEDYPWAVFWQQTVRGGQLPLWNPYILGGHLHAALSMPALFSPFKLLLLTGNAERALSLGIILQFVIAALSMLAFLRAIGRSPLASFLGAAVWTLNSAFLMWYWRAPAIFCFAPLALLLLERSTWASALVAGGVLGIAFLSGNVQAGAQLALLCVIYAVVGMPGHERRHLASRTTLALALGGLIAAVHWLPTLEALPRDVYAATSARGPVAGWRHTVLGLPMLVTLVFPALTGSTDTLDLLKLIGASRGDFTGYIGVVPAGLALAAALAGRGTRRRVWLSLIAVVLALVFFTPLVKYVYHRIFILIVFALAALAAEGMDMLLTPTEEQRTAIRQAMRVMAAGCVMVLLAVAVAQAVIAWKRPEISAAARRYALARAADHPMGFKREWFADRAERFLGEFRVTNPRFWLPALCGLGVALAWRRLPGGAVVALALVDVWMLGRPLVPQVNRQQYPLDVSHPLLAEVERDRDLFRVHRWGVNSFFLFRPNLLMLAGVHDLGGSFSLSPPTVESLPSIRADGTPNRLLDMQNVKYIFRPVSEPMLPAERFEFLAETDGVRLFRNRHCLPRAWWVARAEVVANRHELLQRMTADDFDPRAVVLLEEPPTAPVASATGTGEVNITRYTPLRVEAKVRAASAGWLVLADTWERGWRVRVDGQPAKLHRVNGVLRGVFVPGGEHNVAFEFSPWTIRLGAAISFSAATVVLLGALSAAWRSRRRRTPSTSSPPASGIADTTP